MSWLRLTPRLVAVLATHLAAALILALPLGGSAQAVSMDWVTVGDSSNAPDASGMARFVGLSAISYGFRARSNESSCLDAQHLVSRTHGSNLTTHNGF